MISTISRLLKKMDTFKVICQSVSDINPTLALFVPTNAEQNQQTRIAKRYGLEICWEVFADRRYEPSGLITLAPVSSEILALS